jgi:hypothetical protein
VRRLRIQLLSDLHLESQPQFAPGVAEDADVLVLAGDIGSYQPGSRLPQAPRDFGLTPFAAQSKGGRWPVVLYVPGNHEYDGGDFDAIDAELRRVVESLGMVWLERACFVHRGVRFVGTTLWSDFDVLVARADPPPSEEKALKMRAKAFRAADFYLAKMASTRHGAPFLAEQVRAQSLLCQQWLRQALAEPFAGPTVAVTHFAPSLRSADPRYGLVPGTAGFCNALDDLLPLADVWMHGHLHCPNDYRVPAPERPGGSCRVVSNALGYAAKGEQEGFAPLFTVDIPLC